MMDQDDWDAKLKATPDAYVACGAALADEFRRVSAAIESVISAMASLLLLSFRRSPPRYNQRALLVMKRRLSAARRIRRVRVQERRA